MSAQKAKPRKRSTVGARPKSKLKLAEYDLNEVKINKLPPQPQPDKEFMERTRRGFQMYCSSSNVSAIVNLLKVMVQRDTELIIQMAKDVIIFSLPDRKQATMDISAVFYRTAFDVFYVDLNETAPVESDDILAYDYRVRSDAIGEACNSFGVKRGENIFTMCVSRDNDSSAAKFVIHNFNVLTEVKTQYTIPMTKRGPSIVRNLDAIQRPVPGKYSLVASIGVIKHVLVKMMRYRKTPFALIFNPDVVRMYGSETTEWMIEIKPSEEHPACVYRTSGNKPVIIKGVTVSDIIPHRKLTEIVSSVWINEPPEFDASESDDDMLSVDRQSKVQCIYKLVGNQGFVVYEQWA